MSRNTRSVGRSTSVEEPSRRLDEHVRDRQLLVVSNRQPYRHDYADDEGLTVDRPTGGLTAGLDPVMQRTGGTWIAWGEGDGDREVADSNGCVSVPPDDPCYVLKHVWLSDEQVRDYYYGYSNQVLWPVCHAALTNVSCEPSFWRRYRRVNERFADAVVDRTDDRPLVWFQDYHLALAPRLARYYLPDDAVLLHFWHIPWPGWDTFRACPHGTELLEGLLGNDMLGFHVPRYRTNFLRCVDAALDDAVVDWEAGEVTYRGNVTAVEAIPMGTPVDRIRRSAAASTPDAFWSSFGSEYDVTPGTRLSVGVDRLDYTKGIVERLRALERLWAVSPRWRGELTHVQIGSESRSRIPAYREVQEQVADEVDRINHRFETDDWRPVVYGTDHIPSEELYGLYRHADLGVVSPIRDGMNLVAQEYAAAQVENDGVLVLSDQAGLHDEVGEYAVTVTPSDVEGFAAAIERALTMPPRERRRRMQGLRQWVTAHDLETWSETNFRAAIETASAGRRSVAME